MMRANQRRVRVVSLVAVMTLVLAACASSSDPTTTPAPTTTTPGPTTTAPQASTTLPPPPPLSGDLEGAGATFPQNVYDMWLFVYTRDVQPDVSINYGGVGSGGGRQRFIDGLIDWGTSEGFMNEGELEAAEATWGCVPDLWPALFGAVAVAFGDPEFEGLILTPGVIADIFEARITNFNDPKIAALNQGRDLPDREIRRIVRSDSSGTTTVFTNYLKNHTDVFETEPGGLPTWPEDAAGRPPEGGAGNSGVADLLGSAEAAIGYIGQDYAMETGLPVARVVNSAGNAVAPTLAATEEALSTITIPINESFAVRDVGGEGYPIVAVVWNITSQCGVDENTAALLQDFWTWAVSSREARTLALALNFVPLPEELVPDILEVISKIGSAE